ncbi:MAG: S24/S26 family peptidase [Nibricoccus sp.]
MRSLTARCFRPLIISGIVIAALQAADTPPPPAAEAPPAATPAAPTDAVPTAPSKPTPAGTQKLVPSSDLSRVQAWKDAEKVAQMGDGRVSAAGSGGSMQPVYGDNTMIVITKIAFEELKPGMTVAYMNRKGHQVVHQVIKKTAKGWDVQGLNNESGDHELVTRENLLGVVYASISAEEP